MAVFIPLSGRYTAQGRRSVAGDRQNHLAYVRLTAYVNRAVLGYLCAIVLAVAIQLAAISDARAQPMVLVALGDSLTAGFGLAPEQAFPVRLERALRARGHEVEIINAGVSGDTSAGGLARVDWSVGPEVDGVIVELGANDALRGISPAKTRANLDRLIARLSEKKAAVLLAGMLAPRNLGQDYARAFDSVFPDLASKHKVIFYPFFLEGVATEERLNLADGMHPNGQGVDVIVERMLPSVEQLLDRIAARIDAGK